MLIVNDDHLRLTGISSLEERCSYCSRPLTAYPLIMSEDAKQTVYHIACAIQLATDILVDLYTFFSPPVPYHQLYVLTASQAPSFQDATSEKTEKEGVTDAINGYHPD
jgi:hypothetical protein